MWIDNKEVVEGCKKDDVRRLPSGACQRNVDLWLEFFKLREECKTSLTISLIRRPSEN